MDEKSMCEQEKSRNQQKVAKVLGKFLGRFARNPAPPMRIVAELCESRLTLFRKVAIVGVGQYGDDQARDIATRTRALLAVNYGYIVAAAGKGGGGENDDLLLEGTIRFSLPGPATRPCPHGTFRFEGVSVGRVRVMCAKLFKDPMFGVKPEEKQVPQVTRKGEVLVDAGFD